MSAEREHPDVYVVGLGIRGPQQVTAETERALRACREVLFVDTGVGAEAWLAERCARVTPLYASYQPGAIRLEAYHAMAARTLEAALAHPPVAFAMQGHPLVGAYAPVLIRDLAGLLGLEVRVLPGISALACLLDVLELDPLLEGLHLHEATDLLLRRRPLQPDVPTLIWQVGALETRLHTLRPSRPARFARFLAHLLGFYPPTHPVVAVCAAPHPLMDDQVLRFALADLPAQAEALHPGFTLYLPPAVRRPVHDPALLALVDDPAHLARITRE